MPDGIYLVYSGCRRKSTKVSAAVLVKRGRCIGWGSGMSSTFCALMSKLVKKLCCQLGVVIVSETSDVLLDDAVRVKFAHRGDDPKFLHSAIKAV